MASSMHAAQTRLDIAAQNLANVSSSGFRRSAAHAVLSDAGVTVQVTPDARPGPLRRTGRAFDLAVAGKGAFIVRGADGRAEHGRSASLERDGRGQLVDEQGRFLQGLHGPILVGADTSIDERGFVRENGKIIDRVRTTPGTVLSSGFLEAANVDAIHEMVDVLTAQRAFEIAQKTLSAIDDVRSKAASQTGVVKS